MVPSAPFAAPRAAAGRWRAPILAGALVAALAGGALLGARTGPGLAFYVALAARGRVAPTPQLLLRGARVLAPPEWRASEPVDVRIEDARVVAIGDAGSLTASGGERVIEAGGRVLTAALCDLRV